MTRPDSPDPDAAPPKFFVPGPGTPPPRVDGPPAAPDRDGGARPGGPPLPPTRVQPAARPAASPPPGAAASPRAPRPVQGSQIGGRGASRGPGAAPPAAGGAGGATRGAARGAAKGAALGGKVAAKGAAGGVGFLRRALTPKLRWFVLYLPILLVLIPVAAIVWLWSTFSAINTVDLGDALAAPGSGPQNYLLVGSDSRAELDPENPDAEAPSVAGKRSDTIIVLRVVDGKTLMMSVPRDLWVTQADSGRKDRVNASYNKGPANLVRTVSTALNLPIHHYVEVDFQSFSGVVDAIGGVTINFPNPAGDPKSGLNITTAGDHVLNGEQALAYVRSRTYTEQINGSTKVDPTADLGREKRQQQFLSSALGEVGATRNPFQLAGVASAFTNGLTIDSELGLWASIGLARGLTGSTTESVILPTSPARISGKAVLQLQEAEAKPALDRFR